MLKRKILLVDDSVDMAQVLKRLIELRTGYEVWVARGLSDLQDLNPSALMSCECAILDIDLGSEQPNGLDVCRWLRQKGFLGKIHFLTGHAPNHPLITQAHVAGYMSPGSQVLSKPFSPTHLCDLLEY